MADYKVVDATQLDADLTIVADAIRSKGGTTGQLDFPSGFKSVVENINTSKEEQEKSVDITENGTKEVIPDLGKVLSKVIVNTAVASGVGSGGISAVKFLDEDIEVEESTSTKVTYNIDGVEVPTMASSPTKWNAFLGNEVYIFFINRKEITGADVTNAVVNAVHVGFAHSNYGKSMSGSTGLNNVSGANMKGVMQGFVESGISSVTSITNGKVNASVYVGVQNAGYPVLQGTYNIQAWMLTDFIWGVQL